MVAMIVYGAASAGVAAQIQPILDHVLPKHEELGQIIGAILALYLIKGIGAYLSGYLMTDVGQRVVRDLRNLLFTPHPRPVGGVLFGADQRQADVAHHQRRRRRCSRRSPRRSATWRASRCRWSALPALLFYYDARLAMVCLTGAPLVVYPLVGSGSGSGARRGAARRRSSRSRTCRAEAFTGHRIVKAFGAEQRETAKFQAASERLYRTSMKVTSALSVLPPLMEFIGGVAFAVRAVVRQPGDQRGAPDDRRVRRRSSRRCS